MSGQAWGGTFVFRNIEVDPVPTQGGWSPRMFAPSVDGEADSERVPF